MHVCVCEHVPMCIRGVCVCVCVDIEERANKCELSIVRLCMYVWSGEGSKGDMLSSLLF